MKKFFIITSVLFGVFLFFFLIYNFLFASNPFSGKVSNVAVVPSPKTDDEDKGVKKGAEGRIAPVSDKEATAPFFDGKTRSLLYLSPDDRMIKEFFPLSKTTRTVVEIPFVPKGILWSPNMSQAIVKRSDVEWVLFLRETKELKLLKLGIESPAWSSLGDKIFYKYYDSGTKKRTLNVSSPDGSDWQTIGETDFQFLETRGIPKSSSVAYWNRGNAFERTDLRSLSVVGGEEKRLSILGFGVDYLFSPNGKLILTSGLVEKGGSGITLGTINTGGGEYRNLFIPTFAGKAAWSKNGRELYYALPGSVPPGSVLPNDYYRTPILTADTFWKVSLDTNEKSRVIDPGEIGESYDAEFLTLDDEETELFFRNRRDGKIYGIKL